MPMTDSLDAEIRSLIAELMDAVPPPPLLDEEEWFIADETRMETGSRWIRRPSRVPIFGGVFGVAIVVSVVFLVVFLSSSSPLVANAAAAELQRVAASAEQQPALVLRSNQWLLTNNQESAMVDIFPLSAARNQTTNAQATIGSTIQEWANTAGTSCVSLTSSSAQFSTPANMTAWLANGFLANPSPREQANNGCVSYGGTQENGLGAGVGAISVANLPTDPQALAQALSNGTTGIQGLDRLSSGDSINGGLRTGDDSANRTYDRRNPDIQWSSFSCACTDPWDPTTR